VPVRGIARSPRAFNGHDQEAGAPGLPQVATVHFSAADMVERDTSPRAHVTRPAGSRTHAWE